MVMTNREKNNMALPGFTANVSIRSTTEEYRRVIKHYRIGFQQIIQPSMKKQEGGADICDVCERNGMRCCWRPAGGGEFYCC